MKDPQFTENDFQIFQIPDLPGRMAAIRQQIQPKFQQIGSIIADFLTVTFQQPFHVHIAKHARRTVHPPEQTWVAWSTHRRGYKPNPHFQFGIDSQSLFIWFSIFRECKQKEHFSIRFIERFNEWWPQLPSDYQFSEDHTKPERTQISELGKAVMQEKLKRLGQVKKAEFLCGRLIPRQKSETLAGDALIQQIQLTFQTLSPLYQITQSYEAKPRL